MAILSSSASLRKLSNENMRQIDSGARFVGKGVMRIIVLCTVFFILACDSATSAAQLKRVRFSVSTIAITELPFKLAQVKGFYRDEGLDVETILIRGALGVQALVGKSVDYSSASGALIAAAVRGLDTRLLLIVSSKPQFDFVSQPQIRSIEQLKGKAVGISSRGGAVDLLTQLILTKHGLVPHKDVTLLVIGSPEEMMISLKSGLIAATLLTPPRQLMLYREGYNQLAYAGDYLATYPTGGIGTTADKIKNNAAEVAGFIRASLKGLRYYQENRSESVNLISQYLGLKDLSFAGQVYDLHTSRLDTSGSADEAWMRGAIEFTKKSLAVTKEVATGQVFDFSFVEKAGR
jgi:NitT/TauT family transport system substrate-binding protein